MSDAAAADTAARIERVRALTGELATAWDSHKPPILNRIDHALDALVAELSGLRAARDEREVSPTCEGCSAPATERAISPEDGELWFCAECYVALVGEPSSEEVAGLRRWLDRDVGDGSRHKALDALVRRAEVAEAALREARAERTSFVGELARLLGPRPANLRHGVTANDWWITAVGNALGERDSLAAALEQAQAARAAFEDALAFERSLSESAYAALHAIADYHGPAKFVGTLVDGTKVYSGQEQIMAIARAALAGQTKTVFPWIKDGGGTLAGQTTDTAAETGTATDGGER